MNFKVSIVFARAYFAIAYLSASYKPNRFHTHYFRQPEIPHSCLKGLNDWVSDVETTDKIFSQDSTSDESFPLNHLISKLFDENQGVVHNDKESTKGKPNPFLEIVWSLRKKKLSTLFVIIQMCSLCSTIPQIFFLFCYLCVCILRVDSLGIKRNWYFIPFLYLSFLQTSIYQNACFSDHQDVSSECVHTNYHKNMIENDHFFFLGSFVHFNRH